MGRVLVFLLFLSGCASQWKVQGGPKECVKMCEDWGMELTGMVGVGNQERTGDGASACVCEVPKREGMSAGASGTSASTSAAIVALQRQRAAQQAAMAAHH